MIRVAAPTRSDSSTSVEKQTVEYEKAVAAATGFIPVEAPRQMTPVETVLSAIWREALGLASLATQENFYALGGDSLIAMQMTARLNAALHINLPVTAIFDYPTVAALAELVESALRYQPQQAPVVVDRLASKQLAPLSFAQEHMWLIQQLQPESSAYNIEVTIRLKGPLLIPVLERSLQEIIRRHATLRTTVALVDNRPMQRISPQADLPMHIVDLCSLFPAAREEEMLRRARAEACQPFDLMRGPVMRAALYRLSPADHVFQVVVHHIAADDWASGLLLQELSALYTAYAEGEPSQLDEPSHDFADYAEWERNWYQGEVYQQDLDYWRQHAANVPALSLPLDHPRPALQSSKGEIVEFTPSQEFVAALKQFSRREGTTYYITLLSAFSVLMHRYSGQEDFAVGVPMANRQYGDSPKLVGTFMNSLPVRSDLSGNPSFREFLRRVHHAATEAFAHQQLPYEKLVTELRPARDLSHKPLFQVICNGLTMPVRSVVFTGLEWKRVILHKSGAQVDLQLYILDSMWEQRYALEFSSDIFEKATIERMLAQYEMLLKSIMADPDCALSCLPLLPPAEHNQLLHRWNATERDYPHELCVHELVAAQTARTPDNVAVVYEDQQITFAALDRRASQLAAYLRAAGIGPGALVGICLDRSINMIVALLGILKAGGAYLPLDPAFPLDRLAYMLEDSKAALLLTQDGLLPELIDLLPAPGPRVVYMDRQWQEIAATEEAPATSAALPDDLAYIIYTSGSTGKPKGVRLQHRNVVNFLLSMQEEPGLDPQDKLLSITTLSFDIAVLEIMLPLITGAQVFLASQSTAHDGRHLGSCLAESGATVMQATPATWRMLIAAGWQGDGRLKALCGGEAMPADLAQQLLARVGSLWNMYGPTETTVWSTVSKIESAAEPILIGRPIANTQLYLLDAHMQPVPTGAVGELYIGGDGVALGYLNRPELTVERFVRDPFQSRPEAKLYRTGDLARYRAGGSLEFLGRADFQVKVRGFRIELGEIESALYEHPAVAQAVVTAWDDDSGGKYLAAYVLSHAQPAPSPADLRQFLLARLPQYMVPSAIVPVPGFPLTPTGKVDRKRLPHPGQFTATSRSQPYAPPRTPLELQLMQVWEVVLGQHPISIHDNFFEIGGHSLVAARLFVQIENWLGRRLPLATLFQSPTIAELAAVMQDDLWTPPWSSLVPIQPAGSLPPLFCVHGFGGDVVGYRDLALLLGPDQPFYGLQARGLGDTDEPHTDVVAMAADYIRFVRRLQPQGPYYLGGYCYGGVVAFEMARQLEAQGERVNLVAVMDGYAVNKAEARSRLWRPRELSSFLRNLPNWLRDKLHEDGPFAHRWRRGSGHSQTPQGSKRNTKTADADETSAAGRCDYTSRRAKLMIAHDDAMVRYQLAPYGGRVTLLRVKTMSLFRSHDPEMGWGRWAEQGVDVRMIAGAHYNILEQPHVQDLAAQLRASLDVAQASEERG